MSAREANHILEHIDPLEAMVNGEAFFDLVLDAPINELSRLHLGRRITSAILAPVIPLLQNCSRFVILASPKANYLGTVKANTAAFR